MNPDWFDRLPQPGLRNEQGAQAEEVRCGTAWSKRRHSTNRKAWNDLAAERDKAVKQVRRYSVEALK
jgi:hypothetical protein